MHISCTSKLTNLASRVVGAPLATEGATAPVNTGTAENTTDVTGETRQTAVAPAAGNTGRESAPKANKRGSIFGNFFNKKDVSSPTAAEIAPAASAKDGEAALSSSTAPQLENPMNSPAAGTTMTANEPSLITKEVAASPTTPSATPETTKPQRRTSFFNNLGTKKERRSEATSDAEGTDGEGKKSTGSKLGGLFRKPSRAAQTSSTKTEPTSPGPNVSEPTSAPAIGNEPATTNSNNVIPDSSNKMESQQTPVQASA